MIPNNFKTSIRIPSQLPEFIRDDLNYETFVAFVQAYYEWLELANIGLRWAAPTGPTRGGLSDLAAAAQPSVGKFGEYISQEAALAKQQRKELSALTDKELGYLKDQTGLSMDEIKRSIDAKKTILEAKSKGADVPLDTINKIRGAEAASRGEALKAGTAMSGLVARQAALDSAKARLAKAMQEKAMTSGDVNALAKQTAAKYNFIFDETTGSIKTAQGQVLDSNDPRYQQYLNDLIKSVETFQPSSSYVKALKTLQTPNAGDTQPPPPAGFTVKQ